MLKAEDRLRRVVEYAPLVLWVIDREGVFTLSEGRGLSSLGLAPGQVVGMSAFDVYKDLPAVLADLRRALAGEEFTGVVDVGDLCFESRYSPIFDDDGRVRSVLGVSVDIKVLFPAESTVAVVEPKSLRPVAGRGHVLLIDDDDGVRKATRSMLELLGYTVQSAIHGREGVELLRATPDAFAIVLLDMTMPEMSGEETYCEIRRITPAQRVVLMSGYTESEATRGLMAKGFAGFLQKPFSLADLAERLGAGINAPV